jgi:glycine/D-amino acid oxidase-like deaminating enzyme
MKWVKFVQGKGMVGLIVAAHLERTGRLLIITGSLSGGSQTKWNTRIHRTIVTH